MKLMSGVMKPFAGAVTAGLFLVAAAAGQASAETRGYVVSWFGVSTYFGGDSDCPDGLNPMSTEFYHRELLKLGYSEADATRLLKDFPGNPGLPDGEYIKIMMTRGDKKHNVYAFPETEADPGLKEIKGKFAYGFDLDGKTDSPISFTDPDTGEKGIKNQLYRVLGCVRSFRAPPPAHPTLAQAQWDVLRDQMPAWVIEVSGITDPKNSDNVQVEIFRATDHVTRDANGDVRKDMSFTTDPDPRSHNILHGHIKDGVLVTDESDIHLLADPFLMPEFHWTHARLKLRLEPDGSLKGILGGYHDWYALYWSYASSGWVEEHSTSLDMPAFWYSLKRNADADPDPKTGENKSISTAYEVEAVPAFVIHTEEKNDKKVSDAGSAAAPRRIEANVGGWLRGLGW
jgi:hypothetical protein